MKLLLAHLFVVAVSLTVLLVVSSGQAGGRSAGTSKTSGTTGTEAAAVTAIGGETGEARRTTVTDTTAVSPQPLGPRTIDIPVIDRVENRIAGARLAVKVEGRGLVAITDGQGIARFVLAGGRPAVPFQGTAAAPGFLPRRFVVLATGEADIQVKNAYPEDVTHAVVLDRPTVVHGSVTDRGLPVSGARITISYWNWVPPSMCGTGRSAGRTWVTETDGYGDYWIEDIPSGRPFHWFLTAPDGACHFESGLTLPGGTVRRDWDLSSPPAIVGRLRDSRGTPLPGRQVEIRWSVPETPRLTGSALTGPRGEFRFDAVELGGRKQGLTWSGYALTLTDEEEPLLGGDVMIDVPPGSEEVFVDLVADR